MEERKILLKAKGFTRGNKEHSTIRSDKRFTLPYFSRPLVLCIFAAPVAICFVDEGFRLFFAI